MSVTVTTRPRYLNANTSVYTAWDLRGEMGDPPGVGVAGYEDFRVMQRQAGANMSVDIGKTGVGLMLAWVRGSSRGGQGLYRVDNIDRTAPTANTYVAQLNDTVTANASGNPRLDQVVLEVLDQQHAGASNLARVRIVAGTATVGATLDNRTGAAALPTSSILLADILVPNGAASIGTSDIRDRRACPIMGVASWPMTAADIVAFLPVPGTPGPATYQFTPTVHDSMQAAALMYLPRRIVNATKLRWKYSQGGTAATSNWVIGIYDLSGRLICGTSITAFGGGVGVVNEVSATLNITTTFDAGLYWVMIGLAALTASSAVGTTGVSAQSVAAAGSGNAPGAMYRNCFLRSTSGGATAPATLLAFTDAASLTAAANIPPVPMVALSVT